MAGEMFRQAEACPSYWHESVTREELPQAVALPAKARFAIVGLGMAGASIAYELVERGNDPESIVVLDGSRLAFGASGRNAGFVMSYPGPKLMRWREKFGDGPAAQYARLNVRNREWVRTFAEQNKVTSQMGGSFFASDDAAEAEEVAQSHAFIAASNMTGFDLLDTLPGPATGYQKTIFQPRDFGIHPVRYVAALLAAAKVPIVENTMVESDGIRTDKHGVTVETNRGTLRAEHLVLATNAYTPTFFDSLNAKFPLVAARNHVLLVEIEGESTNAMFGDAVYYTRHGYDYWRQLPDGRMLVGGGRDRDLDAESVANLGTNQRIVDYLEGTLLKRLAPGRTTKVVGRWQGLIDLSPDDLPMVGRMPDTHKRVTFVGGFSGYGLGFHRVVAESAVMGLLTGSNFKPFDASRLSA